MKFIDKIDNSNIPWGPVIKFKPNAKRPLEGENESSNILQHLSNISQSSIPCNHPYSHEINTLEYPQWMYRKSLDVIFKPMENTQLTWIDSIGKLKQLSTLLQQCKEFAVDLEHHDYRSFQGFTCLMQVSTRTEDFLIDTLVLRNDLHILNEAFTDPNIAKVFHGAEMDIQWLQRGL